MQNHEPSGTQTMTPIETSIRGSMVALVTPLHPDGTIDYDAFRVLIDWHIEAGTDGVIVAGTTGESATISMEEHCELIRIGVEQARGSVQIIAGTGANSTCEALELSRFAKKVGATAGLSVVPYYNKPTQEGMYRHYRKIAESIDLPMILYNVPGRTVTDLANDTVMRLSQIPGIVGIKDATGDVGRGISLMRELPPGFAVYSGDDDTAAALILLGAQGNISVTANIVPRLMKTLCTAALAGDVGLVRTISRQLAPLNRALFLESNPIPVKWALAQMGRISPTYRLPLSELMPTYHAELREAMRLAGVELES